jgi:hypothetical protein
VSRQKCQQALDKYLCCFAELCRRGGKGKPTLGDIPFSDGPFTPSALIQSAVEAAQARRCSPWQPLSGCMSDSDRLDSWTVLQWSNFRAPSANSEEVLEVPEGFYNLCLLKVLLRCYNPLYLCSRLVLQINLKVIDPDWLVMMLTFMKTVK